MISRSDKRLSQGLKPHTLILIITAVAAIALGIERFTTYQYQKRVLSTLQHTQHDTIKHIREWHHARQDAAQLIASQPQVLAGFHLLNVLVEQPSDLVSAEAQHRLREALSRQLIQNGFTAYTLLNREGKILAALDDAPLGQPAALTNQTALFSSLNRGQPVLSTISQSQISASTGTQDFVTQHVLAPVMESSQQVVAYLALEMKPDNEFDSFLQDSRKAGLGETYLFNRDGLMLTESTNHEQLTRIGLLQTGESSILNLAIRDPGINLTESDFIPRPDRTLPLTTMALSATAGNNGNNLQGYRDYRGVNVVGTWQWLGEFNMGIATEMPYNLAFRELFETRFLIILIALVSAIAFCGYPILFASRQRALEERQAYLSSIMENSGDGIIVVDINSTIELINNAGAGIFGYAREELIGQRLETLIPATDREFHHRLVVSSTVETSRRIAGNRTLYGLNKSGKQVPIELNVTSLMADGEKKFIGTVRDISERLEANAQILRFKTALDDALDCIFIFDPETLRFSYVNRGAMEQVGYTADEMMAMTPIDIKPTFNPDQFRAVLNQIINSESKQHTFQTIHRHKQGHDIPVEISLQFVEFPLGSPLFVAFVRDITERLSAEETLQRREKTLYSVLDTSVASIVLLDETGMVTEVNNTLLNLCEEFEGPDRQRWISNDFIDVLTLWSSIQLGRESLQETRAAMKRLLSGEIDTWEQQYTFHSKDAPRYYKLYSKAVKDVPGTGCVIKLFDITEFVETQLQLEKASNEAIHATEAKSRFLATMSHEIRTPMNGVVGMIDLLRETQLSAEQRTMVMTIRNSSLSLLTIINDILDLSKIEAGSLALEEVSFSIQDVLDSVGDLLWMTANELRVQLLMVPDLEGPEYFIGDPTRIRQILMNLVSNAIKFSANLSHPGKVKLSCHTETSGEDHNLVIEVQDNGIGMNDAQLIKLFQPYSQADSSTTRRFGGTGLGLNICHHLTSMMNGKITVESQADVGTVFRVTLPLMLDTVQATQQEITDLRGSQYVIVFQNDDPDYLELLGHVLRARQGALLERTHLGAITSAMDKLDKGTVLITTPSVDQTRFSRIMQDQIGNHWQKKFRVLQLDGNPASSKGLIVPNQVITGSHPLKIKDMLYGLEILLGRASPAPNDQLLQDANLSRSLQPPTVEEAAEQGRLILVAEDHPINREVIINQLHKLGFACETAKDGLEAFEMWSKKPYHLLLSDCHMPNLDGFQLTEKIREVEQQNLAQKHLPIIAVTANALVGEADRCLAAGMDGYLSKPVELRLLKQMLDKWLPQERARGSSRPEPLKLAQLAELIGTDNSQLLSSIVDAFMAAAANDRRKLKTAFDAGDMTSLAQYAHAAKGAAHSAAAQPLADALKQLEDAIKSNRTTEITHCFQSVEEEFCRLEKWAKQRTSTPQLV